MHPSDVGKMGSRVRWAGELRDVDPGEMARAIRDGWLHDGIEGWHATVTAGRVLFAPKPNLVVNTGINMRLDRTFAINGPPAAVAKMGVDLADVTASDPVAGTSSSGTNKKTIIGFDSVATRTGQVVTAVGTFTQANVNFIMKRLFLTNTAATLTNSATADDANSLFAMTNRFTIDLTAFATWSQIFSASVTGTGS